MFPPGGEGSAAAFQLGAEYLLAQCRVSVCWEPVRRTGSEGGEAAFRIAVKA